jgi:RNA polymerase sporulation-specific sigma factor
MVYKVDNSEVILLISEWKNSDSHRKLYLENFILNKLSFFIYAKTRIYKKEDFYDDLVQEGLIALRKALGEFDPERCVNFFKVADWYVKTQMRHFLQNHFEIISNEYICDCVEQFMMELECDPQAYYEQKELEILIHNAIRTLPEAYRQIIILRYGIFDTDESTFQEIGENLSVSRQYVEQVEKKALNMLSKNLELRSL